MIDLELNPQADDQKLLAQIVDFYQRTLKNSSEALDFLRKQGITNPDCIEHFRIGYANRTLGKVLPSKERKSGREIRSRLQTLNLFRASSGHEHFNGSVVFPIYSPDGTGRIVDLYGHKIGSWLRQGTLIDLFMMTERTGVWNIEGFGIKDEVILCESLFDALLLWSHGYRNVTSLFGEARLSADLCQAFREYNIRRVMTTCESLAPMILEAGMDCFLVRLPSGLGVSDYARQFEDPAAALGALIRKAEWLGKGKQQAALAVALSKPRADGSETDSPAVPGVADATPLPIQPVASTPSLMPALPQDIEAEQSDDQRDEVVLNIGHRRYRVRGTAKNLSYDMLRVNVLASTDWGLFVDTFDLYSARHRKTFITQAATELVIEEKVIKKDLGRVLLKLEELQDQQIKSALEPKEILPTMTPQEKEEALRLLRDPKLLDRIVTDIPLVGEATNKLVGYLAAVSRKLDQPLAVIIQSSSAAGKTTLMEAVLSLMPGEDQVKFSAMTGQSLYYMGEGDLKHKILAIVEEEGAERASYALKLLQSERELMIASTGKDVSSGRLVTQTYRVEGPVMIFLTTTAIKIDEELLNRCVVLSVDEDREQTRAIHRLQRERQTLQGLLARQDHQQVLALHRNSQRLLRPLLVANPFAKDLTFLNTKTRTRRDHLKYLTLIRAVALLHQYQRPIRSTVHHDEDVHYIEVTLEDIEVANRLASEVLGKSADDLPPQSQRLLNMIEAMVNGVCERQGTDRSDYRFSRRDVRDHTSWGNTQLKVHLKRLVELEYLLVHRGGRGQSFVYELLHGLPIESGPKFFADLIDVDQLRRRRSGQIAEKSGVGRPSVGVKSGDGRIEQIDGTACQSDTNGDCPVNQVQNECQNMETASS
ncbi:MAG: primase [Schlesneria sp.]|nr:primase [Schlesneria sp.]